MTPEEWADYMIAKGDYPDTTREELIQLYNQQHVEMLTQRKPIRTLREQLESEEGGLGS